MWAPLRRVLTDRRGAISPIFGLMIVPLAVAVGASIDVGRAVSARNDLQDAVDSTALALAHLPNSTPLATLQSDATTWLSAELSNKDLGPLTVTVTPTTGQISVSASSNVATTIAAVTGVSRIPISASSTVKWGLSHVELALVLDNTGSMAQNNKLPTLISAATSLVDTLSTSAGTDPAALKISVVPFSMTVNVGSAYQSAGWMSGAMPTAYGADIFNTTGVDRFALFSQMNQTWGGCVESRPAPYDVQDTAPDSSNPATLFTPYFAPDEPDTGGFYNNYLTDGTSGGWQQRQGAVAKYSGSPKTGTNSSTGYAYGPNAGCALTSLLRLTDNTNQMAEVKAKLNQMIAVGDTNIPMGLMWGWHTLSPNAPFADATAYNTQGVMKIVVLLTDGWDQNTVNSDSDTSFYSGDGYVWQNRVSGLNTTSQTSRNAALDARMTAVCNNMKADNIIIYTVRIDVTGVAPTVLQNCATNAADFFDVPNVPDLPGVFANIAGDISQLRISR
ncbi:MAG: pilus assembly protein [Caulobacteraceae bacterium]|nr:pilus assembly protein [Caulobacteraceae bacterium]